MHIFEVEATYGVNVRKNSLIKKDEVIGIAKDFKTKVKSPFDGWIKDVIFDPFSHSFFVEIVPMELVKIYHSNE